MVGFARAPVPLATDSLSIFLALFLFQWSLFFPMVKNIWREGLIKDRCRDLSHTDRQPLEILSC